MSIAGRILAEFGAERRSFMRRRTAVFFTFLFPLLLILIFGALIRADPGGDGLFGQSANYYVPGYIAAVVLFTPLSRMASTVARNREGNRFEKLATTPLARHEWLGAHALVNAIIVSAAAILIFVLVVVVTGADLPAHPLATTVHVPLLLFLAILTFCGLGAVLGRVTDSRDGAVAASNTIGFPLLFLSDTFIPPSMVPEWFVPVMDLSPLTYFARGTRAALYGSESAGADPLIQLLALAILAPLFFAVGAYAVPKTES